MESLPRPVSPLPTLLIVPRIRTNSYGGLYGRQRPWASRPFTKRGTLLYRASIFALCHFWNHVRTPPRPDGPVPVPFTMRFGPLLEFVHGSRGRCTALLALRRTLGGSQTAGIVTPHDVAAELALFLGCGPAQGSWEHHVSSNLYEFARIQRIRTP